MNLQKQNKEIAFRYFLGKMAEAEEARYEELYFTDAAVLEQLQIAQEELIEAYLCGDLSESDHELFDTNFLASPTHRKKLEITRALIQSASMVSKEAYSSIPGNRQVVSQTQSLFDYLRRNHRLLIAAGGLIVLILGFLLWRGLFSQERTPPYQDTIANSNANTNANEYRPEFAQSNNNKGNHNDSSLPRNNTDKRRTEAANQIAVFLMTSATKSPENEKPFVIERTVKAVRLQIVLAPDEYPSYKATIKPLDGEAIFVQTNIKPNRLKSGSIITLEIPANKFTNQSYSIQLEGFSTQGGFTETDKYYFSTRIQQ